MYINLHDQAQQDVLAGSIDGQLQLARLITMVSRRIEPEVLFIDLAGITVATASFLREAALGLRDHCLRREYNLFVVLANLTQKSIDEVDLLTRLAGEPLVICELNQYREPMHPRVIGPLEEKQRVTLAAVQQHGETDAGKLAKASAEQIGTTGWNNRLASLVAKGILVEIRSGRAKRYRTVLEGLTYGN
jgi:hypothetical protein